MGSAGNIFTLMDDFNEYIRKGSNMENKEMWNDGWNNNGYKKEKIMTQEDKVAEQLFEKMDMLCKKNKTVRNGYEKTVNIVIDTSGSMYDCIESVKKIIEKLFSISNGYKFYALYQGEWKSIANLKKDILCGADPNYPFINKLTDQDIVENTAVNIFITDGCFSNRNIFDNDGLKKIPSIILSPYKFPKHVYVPENWRIISMDNQAELEKEKTMKVTELKNGEHFKFTDEKGKICGPAYRKIKGINQTVVLAELNGLYLKAQGNVVKVDEPTESGNKKDVIYFTDLKVGDKFEFVSAKQFGEEWVGVFTKTGLNSVQSSTGKLWDTINAYIKVILVTEKKIEKKIEKKLTFGDLKVGDTFTVTFVRLEGKKIEPHKDSYGIWVNIQVLNKSMFFGGPSESLLLDCQEVELVESEKPVEKKLTIADLDFGEKFRFMNTNAVCIRVDASNGGLKDSNYAYLMPSHSVAWAIGTEEVERVVEEVKKTNKEKVVNLAIGDKFQLSKYKNNTFAIGFDLFKLTGFSFATVTCRNFATGEDWYFENDTEIIPVL